MSSAVEISVVTPCLNMAPTIEETIRSVLDARRKGVNVEYVVVDGGSTDGTLEILDRYETEIDVLITDSVPGQYEAINQGMSETSGPVLSWLNADDIYFPWSLRSVVDIFRQFPRVRWLMGMPAFLTSEGTLNEWAGDITVYPRALIRRGAYRTLLLGYLQQESMFWRRELWEEAGGLDTKYRLAADFALWRRFGERTHLVSVAAPLAAFRRRAGQRSVVFEQQYRGEVVDQMQPGIIGRAYERFESALRLPRALVRRLIWSRGLVVFLDDSSGSWRLKDSWRPLSRRSLAGLVFELQRQSA